MEGLRVTWKASNIANLYASNKSLIQLFRHDQFSAQLNEKCALKSAKYPDIWLIYSGKQKCKQPDLIRWDGRGKYLLVLGFTKGKSGLKNPPIL